MKRFIKKLALRSVLSIFLLQIVALSPLNALLGVEPARVIAASACSAQGSYTSGHKLNPRVGGIALDQAATFLANMDDIKGAYYDATADRIVFVGRDTNTLPQLDKDDLAVAIKSLIFKNTIPAVSIDWGPGGIADPNMSVLYYGGIEDTRFGNVLFNADYKLKQYMLGYNPNGTRLTSSVSGYSSMLDRVVAANPPASAAGGSWRVWISPEYVTLKKDDASGSFVFDQTKMRVQFEPMTSGLHSSFVNAGNAFAQQQTSQYDQFAQETPAYGESKQLAKVVSIVKWLKDNNIASDFNWARDYAPKKIASPRTVAKVVTPYQTAQNGNQWMMQGGVIYDTANTYNADDGSATSMKTAAQSVNAPKEQTHWTFSQSGTTYDAVAVEADAFRSLGGFSTQVSDMKTQLAGNLSLGLDRAYSSFSGAQNRIGRGWDMLPARLTDNKPGYTAGCAPNSGNYQGSYPLKLGFHTLEGEYETFSYACNSLYTADKPEYHSKLTRNLNGSYTVTMKDQSEYIFDAALNLMRIRDKNLNGINYIYNLEHYTTIQADSGQTLSLTYNSQGLMDAVTDWTGRAVHYGYDGEGNLTTVTDPRGGVVHYAYNSGNKLTSITNRTGQVVTTNTYTSEGKLATQQSAGGPTITFAYDLVNRKITATDSNGRVEKTFYDDKARVIEQDDPYNNKTYFTYGTEYAPLTAKDKLNNTTTYTYDSAGNMASLTLPTGKQVTYAYDSKNNVTSIADSRYGTSPKQTTFTYSSTSNVTQKNEAGLITSYTYTAAGNLASQTDALSHTTSWTRGTFGNKLTETDANGNVTTYTYDNLGRTTTQTDPNNKVKSYTYDANNNVLTSNDGAGATTNVYNAENQLTSSISPSSAVTQYTYAASQVLGSTTDAANSLTSYGYDQYKNLTSKQDSLNRTTQYAYDQLDRKTQSTTPLGDATTWAYDANGNITQRTDAKNQVTTYQYDNLNRLTHTIYPNQTGVTYTYDDRGNLLQMVDSSGTTSYAYDTFDRMTSETDPNNQAVAYSYDGANNVTGITYPGNKVVAYNYDPANRLRAVRDWNNAQTNYQYNKNGTLASKTLPNDITSSYTYDSANRVAGVQHVQNGSIVAKYTYLRDVNGNITSSTEYVAPVATKPIINIYGDSLDSGWQDWSWGGIQNFNDATTPYLGSKNLSWTAISSWAGLNLHSTAGVDTAGYASVSFALKASQAGQSYGMQLYDENGNTIGSPISLANYGGAPNVGSYKVYTVPLSALGGTNRTISGLYLQDWSGIIQPAVQIDELKILPDPQPISGPQYGIYDEAMAPGWAANSWSSTNNVADTSNPNTGTKADKWTTSAGWAGLTMTSSTGVNTAGYTSLTFALKATQAGQRVAVELFDQNGNGIAPAIDVANYGGDPVSANYKVYSIPLSALNGTNRVITGFQIQDLTGIAQPAMYIDTAGLSTGAIPAGKPTITVYDEALNSGWQDWSWGSIHNYGDTSHPYTGTKDDSWSVTAGNGAMYLHATNGLDTTGYESLSFALQAGQSGQSYTVQLYDANQAALGSPKYISGYGGTPSVGSYTIYNLPLSDLSGANKTISGFTIQDQTGTSQSAYMDTIKFIPTPPSVPAGQPTAYTYDNLGRVLSAAYPNTTFGYTYDKVGNRLTSSINGTPINYTNNNDNELTAKASTSFTYDANGNMTTAGSKTYGYNYENALTSYADSATSTTVNYVYDGAGNRLEKRVNGTTTTTYVNDLSGSLSRILIANDTLHANQNYYVYGLGLISQGSPDSTTRQYYLEDGLEDMRSIIDKNGFTTANYSYDPYGNQAVTTQTGLTYRGEQSEAETGLIYLRARYYDPSIGRFISKDPFSGYQVKPQTQNGYAYTENNPINLSDPSGLDTYGLYLNGSGGIGIFGGYSLGLAYSDGHFGIVLSRSGGGTTGASAGLGLTFEKTNGANLCSLEGNDGFVGGSVRIGPGVGYDRTWSADGGNTKGNQFTIGAGSAITIPGLPVPLPAEGHGGQSTSWVLKMWKLW